MSACFVRNDGGGGGAARYVGAPSTPLRTSSAPIHKASEAEGGRTQPGMAVPHEPRTQPGMAVPPASYLYGPMQQTLYSRAANTAKGAAVAPGIIIPGETAAIRDSQHGGAAVHVHRSHGVCERLVLILVDQQDAFRVVHLNHGGTT